MGDNNNNEKQKIELIELINGFNERNEFISKIWTWIAILSIFALVSLYIPNRKDSQANDSKNSITNFDTVLYNYSLKDIDSSSINIVIGKLKANKKNESNQSKKQNEVKNVRVPIVDLEVPAKYLILILIGILTALIIRWIEAYHRLISFRYEVIEKLLPSSSIKINTEELESRPIFDGLVYSGTLSAWGAPFDTIKCRIAKKYAFIYFLLLKSGIITVHFGLPGFTIIKAFIVSISDINLRILSGLIIFFSMLSLISLIHGAITEVIYGYKGVKRLYELGYKGVIKK